VRMAGRRRGATRAIEVKGELRDRVIVAV